MDPKPVKQNKRKYKKKAIIIPVIKPNTNIIIAKPFELVVDFCNDF